MSIKSSSGGVLRRVGSRVRHVSSARATVSLPWKSDFDFTPPRLAPGEVTGPPDFVGIGAQKSGTSWWHRLVQTHPGVHVHPGIHKERHFLCRFGTQAFGLEDARRYEGWFPRVPGTISGEWTPDYLCYPWVPGLLAEVAPEVRLLVMLRDPVERFRSGSTHSMYDGIDDPGERAAAAMSRGFYDAQVGWWLDRFDPAQMLVLQYERCIREPEVQLRRTYRFLSLDDSYRPDELRSPVGVTRREKTDLPEQVRRRLVDIYKPDVLALARRLPGLDLSIWPNFADI